MERIRKDRVRPSFLLTQFDARHRHVQVSARIHYGCLAMLELAARHEEGRPVSLREIVARHPIPQPFLVQILQSLRSAGLVTSTRGSGGGYRLNSAPADISILDIATAIGCSEAASTKGDSSMPSREQEAVRQIWNRAEEASRDVLSQTFLSDLMASCGADSPEMFYI